MLTFAQNYEDVILERLFHELDAGFYVDVGACHPQSLSVTKHFYDKGWRGLNVEPIPANYRTFLAQRPRDINLNVAIDVAPGERHFFEVESFDALSTFDPEQADFLRREGYRLKEYQVPTVTLDSVFEEHGLDNVDFLKIDVEGSEASVLKSLDLARYRPKVLVIESMLPGRSFPGWGKHREVSNWDWEPEVLSSGYLFTYYDGISRYYVRSEDRHLLDRLELPICCFDDVHRPEEVEQQAEIQRLWAENAQLNQELHELKTRGFKARIKDLLRYTRFRVKNIINHLMFRIGNAPTAEELPKITVVTPVFNGADYLAETIESVLTQDYPSLEYIIVDGGSTDGTLEIIRSYQAREDFPHRIARVISEPDQGMYDAVAKGLERASGEIFCYLNADDLYECGGLRSVGEYFAGNPKTSVIYHEDIVLKDGWKYPNCRQPDNIDTVDLLRGHILYQDGIFWRREAYASIGGMRRDLKLAGDFDLWLRLSLNFRFVKRPGHVSCFRMRDGQLSNQMERYYQEMSASISDFLASLSPARRLFLVARKPVRAIFRALGRRRAGERLEYPIDFHNMPPPPVSVPPHGAVPPLSPVDGRPVERLLFSTTDTRFGEQEITYVYLDERHQIAVMHPPLPGEKLDALYRKNYSSPPTQISLPPGNSPYRHFDRRGFLGKLLGRFPIEKYVRSMPVIWGDDTFNELRAVLKSARVATDADLRFLDTGCFEGNLLDKIRQSTAWRAFGLEPNAAAVAVAREKGHEVWNCHAEDAAEFIPMEMQFDVIFMGQSIEHMQEPLKVLRRLRLLLAPGGVLVISTPNLDSREIDWYGPKWAHWHTPYHRHIFSPRGLRALAHQVGLLPVCTRSFSNPYWTTLSVALNKIGLGGSASHAVHYDESISLKAQRINYWSKLWWNNFDAGDYFYFVMSEEAADE